MANTDPGTAVFTKYDWPRSHGMVHEFRFDRDFQGRELCQAFEHALDRIFDDAWSPDTIEWMHLEVKDRIVVGLNKAQLGLRTRLPRGVIYLVPRLREPATPAPPARVKGKMPASRIHTGEQVGERAASYQK